MFYFWAALGRAMSGQCAESMRYSDRYVHFSGPDFRACASKLGTDPAEVAQGLLSRFGMEKVASALESELSPV